MKYTDEQYKIFENIAQAKSILRKSGGSIEDEDFLKIVDTTGKDGWTGLLTRFVYIDGIDVDEVISLYADLKKSNLDLAKLNKMSYDEVMDEIYKNDFKTSKGIEFIGRYENYLIFKVDTYEDGLNICSPSWCLKTRGNWDQYQNNGKSVQFVVIDEDYVNKSGKTKLLTPNSPGYMGGYVNTKNPKIRYGITYNLINNKAVIFNDNNTFIYKDYNKSLYSIIEVIESYLGTSYKKIKKKKDNILDFVYQYSEENGEGSWDYTIMDTDYDQLYEKFRQECIEQDIDILDWYHKNKVSIFNSNLTSLNGLADFILYKLSNEDWIEMAHHNDERDSIPLSGMYLIERELSANSYKYIYGFSENKYGRMYILQSFPSIKHWYVYCLSNFTEVFLGSDSVSYYNVNDKLSVITNNIETTLGEVGNRGVRFLGELTLIGILMNPFFGEVIVGNTSVEVNFHAESFIEIISIWFKHFLEKDYDEKFLNKETGEFLANSIYNYFIEKVEFATNNMIEEFLQIVDYTFEQSVDFELETTELLEFFTDLFEGSDLTEVSVTQDEMSPYEELINIKFEVPSDN